MGDVYTLMRYLVAGKVKRQFESPEKLIQHLRRVDKNFEEVVKVYHGGRMFEGSPLDAMQFVIAERDAK